MFYSLKSYRLFLLLGIVQSDSPPKIWDDEIYNIWSESLIEYGYIIVFSEWYLRILDILLTFSLNP